jgi:hypothetical protein
MNWVITKDLLAKDFPGVKSDVGKGNFPLFGCATFLLYHFRLLDDDGNVYYEGRSNDRDSEKAFEPLDWAMVHAGCTAIQYRHFNKWVTL